MTLSLTAQVDCPNTYDGDEDGVIGISDLLGLLALFGDVDSDSDGVFDSEDDCIDETACNYQSNPTESCLYLDVVGVCGGPCNEDADGDGICDFNCGEQVGHEGYNYSTVEIGEQCWFSENCRYLPTVSPSNEESANYPYYYVYDYEGDDVSAAQATINYEAYGALYNWQAVMTEGICPSGWHIPSYSEFEALIEFVGSLATDLVNTPSDSPPWYGTNSSGWSGTPGGLKTWGGGFEAMEEIAYFWGTTDINGNTHWYTMRLTGSPYLFGLHQGYGLSARCLQD